MNVRKDDGWNVDHYSIGEKAPIERYRERVRRWDRREGKNTRLSVIGKGAADETIEQGIKRLALG